ncbi:MAG: DUF1259 domain-containing protein [Bradyrhizobium sp.]|nr:DUF1259 domain-containing protein [Bradyrhizobium sp.]
MANLDLASRLDRRRALALGGGAAGGLILAGTGASAGIVPPRGIPVPDGAPTLAAADAAGAAGLPVQQIESILQAPGTVSNGVLSVSMSRTDLGTVKGPLGVPFEGPFELNLDIYFQSLGRNRAILNGDVTLKPNEVNPFIDAIIKNGLVFQAYHQHYIEENPQTWHIHFRGVGNPLDLARGLHDAIKTATSTPLPQKAGSTSTPLNADRLGQILGGDASVDDGVVSVEVARKNRVRLGGVLISPYLNVANSIEIKPLNKSGSKAAVAPDFSMTADEVVPVTRLTRKLGWFDGCLYNQETDEQPQLYFSHMLKVGDPYQLAREVRKALDLTNAEGASA